MFPIHPPAAVFGRRAMMDQNGLDDGGPGPSDDSPHARPHRSVSNISSTSSDILVAPGPATSNSTSPVPPAAAIDQDAMETRSRVIARVWEGRLMVITMRGYHTKQFFSRLVEGRGHRRIANLKATSLPPITTGPAIDAFAADDAGRNRRGTYSKQYVLDHPEIDWVHRGQGRYLPASEAQKTNTLPRPTNTRTPTSEVQYSANGSDTAPSASASASRSSSYSQGYIRSTKDSHHSVDSAQDRSSFLRRGDSDMLTSPVGQHSQQRSSRPVRRGKAVPTPDTERRSSRITAGQNLNYYVNEDDEDDDIDMGSGSEHTFDKAYVDKHPNERFYHTGNGWYKKGDRPRHHKFAKRRDSEGHAIARSADGAFLFDHTQTIHVSQLHHYPGVEFTHCGNGWYKPATDMVGHWPNAQNSAGLEDYADEDQEDDTTVDRAYTMQHPEVDWVHRGNGRYKRKSSMVSPAPDLSQSMSLDDDEMDEDDGDVERVHHRGSARYARGSASEQWTSSRRRSSVQQEDTALYSKAYVKAHPNERFHHRGQGRYARGPRPKPAVEDDLGDPDDDLGAEALVDTDYVEAHPQETFHHRGQGRWARGLPPPGSSNKVAIRGPGAKERTDLGRPIEDEETESSKLPPLSALLLKSEGPDKYPHVNWYYRGGGKWARITKQDWEALQNNTHARAKPRGRALRTSQPTRGSNIGIDESQADSTGYPRKRRRRFLDPNDEMDLDPEPLDNIRQDSFSRRFPLSRGAYGAGKRTLSKTGSSEAPTPKPRVMTLEEDLLADADMPSLYKENFSPSDSEADDEAGRLFQATFFPMRHPDLLLKPLIKHDPKTRPLENLLKLAAYGEEILNRMQLEYLDSDKITAPHARIPRRPAKGGRLPVDPQFFEDRKEADLYDYHFDARKLGHQDPAHQRIQRDAEGRELRGRRNRSAAQTNGTLPGWDFGDDSVGSKRAVKPVTRFDGIVDQPRKRGRHSTTANGTAASSRAPSMTPDVHAPTPLGGAPYANREYVPQTKGRWAGHIPKRIQELRRESEGPSANVVNNPGAAGPGSGAGASARREPSPAGTVRKGRPPGSKNLHKRRDAGIKKGPRKPKAAEPTTAASSAGSGGTFDTNAPVRRMGLNSILASPASLYS